MDRLLTPHRPPHVGPVNIHEVLRAGAEPDPRRVPAGRARSCATTTRACPRSTATASSSSRRCSTSCATPRRPARRAHARRRAPGEIVLRTRVARQVTIARRRHRLALELQVIDNGPGIPPELRERVFYPLVSGREGGTGLGLTLAQTFVQQHHGSIECDSAAGPDRVRDPAAAHAQCRKRRTERTGRYRDETGLDHRRRPLDPLGVREGADARGHRRSRRSPRRRRR